MNNKWIWLSVILTVFFWGSNFNAIKALSDHMTPITASTLRFAFATLLVWLWYGLSKHPDKRLSHGDKWRLFGLSVLGVLIQNVTIFAAMRYTSAANGAIVMANMPLMGVVLSSLLLATRIRLVQLLGIGLSFIGVLLVITQGHFHALHLNIGDFLMLCALISGCTYTVLTKKWASHIDLFTTVRWTLTLGTLQMIALALWQEQPIIVIQNLTLLDATLLAYMGLCGTLMAYFFWINGAQKLGPQAVTSTTNLIPVFTMFISFLQGETIETFQIVGMTLVICGVLIANLLSNRWNKRNEKEKEKQKELAA